MPAQNGRYKLPWLGIILVVIGIASALAVASLDDKPSPPPATVAP